MNKSFPKGSIWRKCDLQIQPIKQEWLSSVNNDNTKNKIKNSVNDFLKVAKNKSIEVIAITDHNCGQAIDCAISNSYNIKVIPGVELDAKEGWHLLMLFSPEYKERLGKNNWSEVIEVFLLNVCKIESPFFNLDNTIKKVEITTKDLIKKVWNENIGLPIFAHCCSDDGFFKRADNQSRKEILNLFCESKAFFCFEIKNKINQIKEIKTKIKNLSRHELPIPIISSSDASNAGNVGSCITWIKADPNYEGLKQIIYEPDLRVKIQTENPTESETYSMIDYLKIKLPDKVKIKDESGEISDFCLNGSFEIEFSNNLTCIIGGRGTGKSTLIHLIYNKWAPRSLDKLHSINSPLNNLIFSPQTLNKINEFTNCEVPNQVEFFFQNEIEESAKNIKSMSKLISHRLYNLSSLDNKNSLQKLKEKWEISKDEINNLINAYDNIAEIDTTIYSIRENIRILKKQIDIIKSDEYQKFQRKIKELTEKMVDFSQYQQENENLGKEIGLLIDLLDQYNWSDTQGRHALINLKKSLNRYRNILQKKLKEIGEVYNINKFPQKLSDLKREFKEYLSKRGLSAENIEELAGANLKIKEFEKQVQKSKLKKKPYEKIFKRKDEIIKGIKTCYLSYYERFTQVTVVLGEKLAGLSISDKKIQFQLKKDHSVLISKVVDFVKECFKDTTILRSDFIENVIFKDADIESYAINKENIRTFVNSTTNSEKHRLLIQELINDNIFLEKLYFRLLKYFYNINNIQIFTKLGTKFLKNTSFGERCGIVIAIVLVAGTNPIVIDQPEDHLDGKYISDVLVPLIRKQKTNRQIILITRDANIVIGSDAEIIHILEIENEKTEFYPATIENKTYRDKYIWILDGGEKAFLKRERRYNIITY